MDVFQNVIKLVEMRILFFFFFTCPSTVMSPSLRFRYYNHQTTWICMYEEQEKSTFGGRWTNTALSPGSCPM